MAHYAELGVDNIVKRVLYIDTVKCMTNGGIEKEEIGREYLETQHGGTWMKCCLLYTSPSPRDVEESRMPSSA